MKRSYPLLLVALVVSLLQIGVLAWMIHARASVLRDGREIVLKVEPVDPRDLLRGDYVRLGYGISALDAALFSEADRAAGAVEGEPVHVRLARGADGYWTAVSASFSPSADAPGEQVDIRGTAAYSRSLADGGQLRVDYGIERFYLPEGEGRAIEKDMRERSFGIRAAVAKDGQAQIKALLDGDQVVYTEPLY